MRKVPRPEHFSLSPNGRRELIKPERRAFLCGVAALGLGALASPAIVSQALSSSGELNYLGWSGYDFGALFRTFTEKTGITVNFSEQPDQEAMLAQARIAAQGVGADIVEPSIDRLPEWLQADLLQPWNDGNVSLDLYDKAFLTGSAMHKGRRYFLPVVWGTEALAYARPAASQTYGTASLTALFDEKYRGKVAIRPSTGLAAMGRVLEAEGKLPRPWLDGYKDEAAMRQLWDLALAEATRRKAVIGQFWSSENDALAAFRSKGCTLGLTWDTTAQVLTADDVGFVAPREGAFGWLQGYGLLKNARNAEQAHEWARFIVTPEASAAYATAFSANPVSRGAIDRLDGKLRDFLRAAYPDDALSKVWWSPAQPPWFVTLRSEYAQKWQAA